jgi:RecA/RadA recombinase
MAKKATTSDEKVDMKSVLSEFKSIATAKFKDLTKYGSVLSSSIYGEIPEYIDTGSYSLNRLISGFIYGGIPAGRVISFYGDSGTGKSFCLGRAIKDAQEKGYLVIFFDTENAITDKFMKNVGVNTDELWYQPIDQISDLKNYVIHMVNELKKKYPNQKIMIALDSLGNLSCAQEKAFIEKKTDSMTQGAREREIKSMLKELTKFCGLYQIPFVFTNHSMKPQDTNMLPMYVKDKQGGGKQATYMASATILMTKKKLKAEDASAEDKKDGDDNKVDDKKKVGNILMCESTKNRLCPEEEKVEIYLSFASGPNKYFGLEDDAVKAGCFERVNDKNYIVKHLDRKIHVSKLFNEKVFTKEVLDAINEYCLKTYTYTKMNSKKPEDELEVEILDSDEEDDSESDS